jgi:CheY-like chemotaxis protein
MSGPVLVKEIRSKMGLKQPKIIIMSGGVDENDTDSLNLKGMVDGYLYKPFTNQTLYDLILKLFPAKT